MLLFAHLAGFFRGLSVEDLLHLGVQSHHSFNLFFQVEIVRLEVVYSFLEFCHLRVLLPVALVGQILEVNGAVGAEG